MPYILCDQVCVKCGESNVLFRNRWNKDREKYFLQTSCKKCDSLNTKVHQENNKDKWAAYNHKAYVKKHGPLTRVMNRTEEDRAQRARDKSNRRCNRAKAARFTDELTKFVTAEAHDLRKLRNNMTGFEWHVDHVIPLKGKYVSGLHIWSNLEVIPKVTNLRKGAKIALHENS